MLATFSLVVAALSTGNKIGLALVGGAFILFALVSSFVLPARYPNFPGRHVGWYVVAGICFFIAMISAVIIFGVESPEAEKGTISVEVSTSASTSTSATPPAQGDPTAGKAIFTSAGCAGCHTLKAAAATGKVGPNLDQLKPAYDRVVHQVEVGGGAMPSFKSTLSAKQIRDVAAFVVTSTQNAPKNDETRSGDERESPQ